VKHFAVVAGDLPMQAATVMPIFRVCPPRPTVAFSAIP
jgi:hypothetical protein